MPVRALRPSNRSARASAFVICQNPINARKGITTPTLPSVPPGKWLVRILLMPVRALRPASYVLMKRQAISVRILLMPVRALRQGPTPCVSLCTSSVRILLMPVRALRPINDFRAERFLFCQNPINARKGITTRRSRHRANTPSQGQNPINARKGITTQLDVEHLRFRIPAE